MDTARPAEQLYQKTTKSTKVDSRSKNADKVKKRNNNSKERTRHCCYCCASAWEITVNSLANK